MASRNEQEFETIHFQKSHLCFCHVGGVTIATHDPVCTTLDQVDTDVRSRYHRVVVFAHTILKQARIESLFHMDRYK